jgi:N-acetyl-S-(2-succino)cysteine monooxygenase
MMHLGLSLSPFGHHPAAWRVPDASPRALAFENFLRQAKLAEEAAFDFVFLADSNAQRPLFEPTPQAVPFEPTMLAAALATRVKHIGLIVSAANAQHELYNLARRFASLDLISGGRVGWNLITSGPTPGWDREYAEVVSALWESWDEDAFLYDKAAGRFFAPQKMRVLDHRGEHFTVRGPLNVNPSPQGKPVIVQVLAPQELANATPAAEVFMLPDAGFEKGSAHGAETRQFLQGLCGADVRVRALATVIPWIGATRTQAQDRFDELNARSSPPEATRAPQGRNLIGTAADIADALEESFERDELDGFTILPPVEPRGLESFVSLIVPELRRRGLVRTGYEGSTLREHLHLDTPRRATT